MTTATKLFNAATLNSWNNDYNTSEGVRISVPLYVDIPQQTRKDLFSRLRAVTEAEKVVTNPPTQSGISVATAIPGGSSVERHIGITLDNLRSVLFSRGGIDVSLLIRIQSVVGEAVPAKEIENALKQKIVQLKEFIAANSYTPVV